MNAKHELVTNPPTDDEREALAAICREYAYRPVGQEVDAILAAGFRRQGPITDAQVQAARDSLYRQGNRYPSMEDMRAALEAAEATR